jgi:hypothetical protein
MSRNEISANRATPTDELRPIIKSQLHAALVTLRDAVDQCSDDLWLDDTPPNAFWQIAYHATFIAHVYLHPTFDTFRPWSGHQANVQQPDGLRAPADGDSSLPMLPDPYTRAQVLEFCDICDGMVDGAVDSFDLDSWDCGFSWYPDMSKLEHQFVSIRHIQHHAAQLADRLRGASDVGIGWVKAVGKS